MNLVIVESPTKARTIKSFLKNNYQVEASFGHVRDLPPNSIGIDIKNNFEQKYIILPKSKKIIAKLKKLLPKTNLVIMATDEDREGEAIAWHLKEVLKIDDAKIKRIVFHEITKQAIEQALKNPRVINEYFVNSYKARRVLDRIVGFKLSPFLWKKVARGLSAGRVQSPALRLICEREEEILNFNPQTYYKITGTFRRKNNETFKALIFKINAEKIKKPGILEKTFVEKIIKELKGKNACISKIVKKIKNINPLPSFKTSTLQQDAFRRLGFASKSTMFIAQKLYEGVEINGKPTSLITYHRTDSLNLSQDFLNQLFSFGRINFPTYMLNSPRLYKTRSKVAFEAHEAIRPINITITPETIKDKIDLKFYKLYDLIWRRSLASQMKPMQYEEINLEIQVISKPYEFIKIGTNLLFDGFTKIYPVLFKEEILPKNLTEKEILHIDEINFEEKQTKPPSRYNEARLIKTLEDYEIGRPSTYAGIISTLLERNYIEKTPDKKLKPTEIGSLVNKVLSEHFKEIVDYDFTAKMESKLDLIAQNKASWIAVMNEFYSWFAKELAEKTKSLTKDKILNNEKINEECPYCKVKLVTRFSKYGKFYGCPNYPNCKYILKNNATKKTIEKSDKLCPNCQVNLVARSSRFGKFFACPNYPECRFILNKKNFFGIS